MAKAPTAAEERHHARLREMGCLVCGDTPSIHHVVSNNYMRITKDHRLVAPLCPPHHTDSPEAVHRMGQEGFNDLHGLDLLEWAIEQWGISAIAEFDHLRRVA